MSERLSEGLHAKRERLQREMLEIYEMQDEACSKQIADLVRRGGDDTAYWRERAIRAERELAEVRERLAARREFGRLLRTRLGEKNAELAEARALARRVTIAADDLMTLMEHEPKNSRVSDAFDVLCATVWSDPDVRALLAPRSGGLAEKSE